MGDWGTLRLHDHKGGRGFEMYRKGLKDKIYIACGIIINDQTIRKGEHFCVENC